MDDRTKALVTKAVEGTPRQRLASLSALRAQMETAFNTAVSRVAHMPQFQAAIATLQSTLLHEHALMAADSGSRDPLRAKVATTVTDVTSPEGRSSLLEVVLSESAPIRKSMEDAAVRSVYRRLISSCSVDLHPDVDPTLAAAVNEAYDRGDLNFLLSVSESIRGGQSISAVPDHLIASAADRIDRVLAKGHSKLADVFSAFMNLQSATSVEQKEFTAEWLQHALVTLVNGATRRVHARIAALHAARSNQSTEPPNEEQTTTSQS